MNFSLNVIFVVKVGYGVYGDKVLCLLPILCQTFLLTVDFLYCQKKSLSIYLTLYHKLQCDHHKSQFFGHNKIYPQASTRVLKMSCTHQIFTTVAETMQLWLKCCSRDTVKALFNATTNLLTSVKLMGFNFFQICWAKIYFTTWVNLRVLKFHCKMVIIIFM